MNNYQLWLQHLLKISTNVNSCIPFINLCQVSFRRFTLVPRRHKKIEVYQTNMYACKPFCMVQNICVTFVLLTRPSSCKSYFNHVSYKKIQILWVAHQYKTNIYHSRCLRCWMQWLNILQRHCCKRYVDTSFWDANCVFIWGKIVCLHSLKYKMALCEPNKSGWAFQFM